MPKYEANNDATLLQIFPEPGTTIRGGDEVNGLSLDTVPRGKLLASYAPDREKDRVFHLVEANNERLYLRVCLAMPGSGYDAFAVIHERFEAGSAQAQALEQYCQESIDCGYFIPIAPDVHPTIGNAVAYRDQVLATKSDQAYGL